MPDTPDAEGARTLLAFDFGMRRIGVAVGQDVTGSASPLGVVVNGAGGPDHPGIERLIREWRPNLLLVGMPAHVDGSPSDMQVRVKAFMDELEQYQLPVVSIDERYSSIEAEEVLKNARKAGSRGKIDKESIDAAAAVVIAERYLAGQ